MKIMTDAELLKEGVEPYLIELRRECNDKIKAGFCLFGGIKVERAFISNPLGYNKVFLLGVNGSILEHGISSNKFEFPKS